MADDDGERPDLFARRNRMRILGLLVLATVNYWMAICAAMVATSLLGIFWLIGEGGVPDDLQLLKWFLVFIVVVILLSIVVGSFVSLFRLPFLRGKLERQVLAETGARLANPDDFPEVRNVLEGLAISAGIPPPRFAVIQDVAPNSFGVGTRPKNTIIGITSGLVHHLNRDELEGILSYEVSRIGSWDIALSSWAVALTSSAIAAAEADDLKAIIGWIPARMAEWLQAWALRNQGEDRDRVAIQFTRHPEALITALEKLESDQGQIVRVSRATAPLWIEVPDGVYGGALSSRSKRMGTSLLLRNRIVLLTKLAGLPPRPVPPKTGRAPILPPDPHRPPAPVPIVGQAPMVPNPANPYAHLPPPPTPAGAAPTATPDYSHLPPPPTSTPPPVAPPSIPDEDDDPSGGFRVG
jgi:heat shock protein HtpX